MGQQCSRVKQRQCSQVFRVKLCCGLIGYTGGVFVWPLLLHGQA